MFISVLGVFIVALCFSFTSFLFFFFNDTATTEIYTLSLHDALPIFPLRDRVRPPGRRDDLCAAERSEEHTSELQSPDHLVCRLLLEKKKKSRDCRGQHMRHSKSCDEPERTTTI